MFFAVNKNDEFHSYSSKNLMGLCEELNGSLHEFADFEFYKGTKIEVREVPSRLELVPEAKKSAPVRKPVAKSKTK